MKLPKFSAPVGFSLRALLLCLLVCGVASTSLAQDMQSVSGDERAGLRIQFTRESQRLQNLNKHAVRVFLKFYYSEVRGDRTYDPRDFSVELQPGEDITEMLFRDATAQNLEIELVRALAIGAPLADAQAQQLNRQFLEKRSDGVFRSLEWASAFSLEGNRAGVREYLGYAEEALKRIPVRDEMQFILDDLLGMVRQSPGSRKRIFTGFTTSAREEEGWIRDFHSLLAVLPARAGTAPANTSVSTTVNPPPAVGLVEPVRPPPPPPEPPAAPPIFPSLASLFGDSTTPVSGPSVSEIFQNSLEQLLAPDPLGQKLDDLLADVKRPGKVPLINLPDPKKPGEKGDWREKPGLRVTAWVNDFLFIHASVSTCVCNAKGEASFSGGYLKVYNAGKKPFHFSSKAAGQISNMIVQPGETYLQRLTIGRTAQEWRDNPIVVDMEATYWKETW